MSRWWRAYDEAVDDPKLQQLPAALFRAWFNICCLTSQNGGRLPAIGIIAFKLRCSDDKASETLDKLSEAGLIDEIPNDDGTHHLAPHNWKGRQFQSDTSTPRVKRFRQNKRNVSPTVSVTPPETEADTEKIAEAKASGADAPRDYRGELFGRGLRTLAEITGKTPDSCRSTVGKWLQMVNDEAVHVLAAIQDCERNRIADPVGHIFKILQTYNRRPNENPRRGSAGSNGITAALAGHAARFEREAFGDDEACPPAPRLLSHR